MNQGHNDLVHLLLSLIRISFFFFPPNMKTYFPTDDQGRHADHHLCQRRHTHDSSKQVLENLTDKRPISVEAHHALLFSAWKISIDWTSAHLFLGAAAAWRSSSRIVGSGDMIRGQGFRHGLQCRSSHCARGRSQNGSWGHVLIQTTLCLW